MVSVYWILIVGVVMLAAGIVVGLLWKWRNTRGEHAYYHPAVTVSAVATRIALESTRGKSAEPMV